MRLGAAAAAAALAIGAAACGTPDANFPAETVCPSPQALPTSRAAPGTVSQQAFVGRIRAGVRELAQAREELRGSYPDDTFYRRDAFRPDFAAYADRTLCLARELRALAAPTERLAAWKANVDTALDALIAHTAAGREAVRTRNVSEYREWYREADAKIDAAEAAANASP
ncbi:MAG: hypothetical protein KatS3mg062_1147 [Tepidiforma sp.]|nr:MAG: hypothetical protein KatS3mg062_1147 [Tepidiforma sp.]